MRSLTGMVLCMVSMTANEQIIATWSITVLNEFVIVLWSFMCDLLYGPITAIVDK